MTALWGWIIKLAGGFIPFLTKPFGEWLGKILWVVGIVLSMYFAKKGIDKLFPPPASQVTQVQSGGQSFDIDYNFPKQPIFGCNSVKVYEYYKDKEVK